MDFSAAMRSFRLHLLAQGKSERTADSHEEAVHALQKRQPQLALGDAGQDHILALLARPDWSDSTRLLRYKGLLAFFAFCVGEGLINQSPMDGIKRPRAGQARRPPRYTDEDIEALRNACARWHWLGMRDEAIVLTLWTTPARVSELCGIKLEDIDWEALRVTLRGKGGVVYQAVIWPECGVILDRYLRHRPWQSKMLFIAQDGDPMTPHAVQLLLRRLRSRSGLTKKVYPHAMRHNFGMKTVRWGLAEDVAAKAMGHRSTAATRIYRQWNAEEEALATIADISQQANGRERLAG